RFAMLAFIEPNARISWHCLFLHMPADGARDGRVQIDCSHHCTSFTWDGYPASAVASVNAFPEAFAGSSTTCARSVATVISLRSCIGGDCETTFAAARRQPHPNDREAFIEHS